MRPSVANPPTPLIFPVWLLALFKSELSPVRRQQIFDDCSICHFYFDGGPEFRAIPLSFNEAEATFSVDEASKVSVNFTHSCNLH